MFLKIKKLPSMVYSVFAVVSKLLLRLIMSLFFDIFLFLIKYCVYMFG